jgi:hypothetical protein
MRSENTCRLISVGIVEILTQTYEDSSISLRMTGNRTRITQILRIFTGNDYSTANICSISIVRVP